MKIVPKTHLTRMASIFGAFLKIGPLTFGGGYAMIPILQREVVDNRRWITEEEMGDVLSLAGSAPGGVGVNASAFIGYRLAGVAGAAVAVLGVTLPTFLIMMLIGVTFANVHDNLKIAAALRGVHAAIIALIIVAAYRTWKTAVMDKSTFGTVIGTLLVLFFTNVHPAIVIIAGLFVGPILVAVKNKLGLVQSEPKETFNDYFIGEGI